MRQPVTIVALAVSAVLMGCATATGERRVAYRVEGDVIAQPLTDAPGDPARGREIVMGRDGNCLLCHALPETGAPFMGNLAPSLSAVGARLDAGALRLRLVDSSRLNPDTVMPPYYRTERLSRVARAFVGKPILDAQQIEDVVAYLERLR